MAEKLLIIGGDKRYEHLKNQLAEKDFTCFHIRNETDIYELENADNYGFLILPVPFSKDLEHIFSGENLRLKIVDVAEKIKPFHKVFLGAADAYTEVLLKEKTPYVYDFFKDESFVYYNACLTAQGALRLLLENTQELIMGKRCLVIGYGKVGENLSKTLSSQGCEVYVTARNPFALMRAQCENFKAFELDFIKQCLYVFDYIFGTVPANLLNENDIAHLDDNAVYFELASAPFTAEKTHFEKHNKKYVAASALPGRYVCKSAAYAIGDYIMKIHKEKGGFI